MDGIDRKIPAKRLNILGSARELMRSALSGELRSRFEHQIGLFGLGIIIYFALPFEPDPIVLAAISVLLLTLWALFLRGSKYRAWIILVLFGVIGCLRAASHTALVDTPVLPADEEAYSVTGWVQAVEKSGTRERWRIRVTGIDELPRSETPKLIRVRIISNNLKVGEGVAFRAVLRAPPPPAMPGGYNPARAAYFQKIGGYGFGVTRPEPATLQALGRVDALQLRIARYRFQLADGIRASAPEENAGLIVALLTGIRTYIPEHQNEALRTAGLAHILAISGLHMGLVSGSIFYLATLFLVLITPLSRKYDMRKPAALIAILAAASYLVLSGASVATQRAFIMACIVFMAIILDLRAISIRSVAIAAFVTLMVHPEALLSAGFQMSFAAVTALVVVYRTWDDHRTYRRPLTWRGRVWAGFSSLSVTSLVAGTATSVYAAYHFNRIATYGLLGNLLAMPFFTFWVMPAALLVYFCLPFGLERYPLWIMSKGIDAVLVISYWVSGLKGALSFVPQAGPWAIILFSAGFFGLCLLRSATGRWIGFIAISASVIMWWKTDIPDMRISTKADVAIWTDSPENILLVDHTNRDRFGRDMFAEQSGRQIYQKTAFSKSDDVSCDSFGCAILYKGQSIQILEKPGAMAEDCDNADLIILKKRPAGIVTRHYCPAEIVDLGKLSKTGALNVYIGEGAIKLVPTFNRQLTARPWGRTYRPGDNQ